ncbi:MAG: tRNA lysidine(34) synthetase TilS, partial [Lysinibacillus sp.]
IYNDTNTFQRYTLCTAILNLCQSRDGSAEVHLPQGMIARRQYELLSIGQYEILPPAIQKELKLNEWHEFIGVRVYIGETSKVPTLSANNTLYYFSTASIALPLRVRTRQQGDKIQCLGMTQAKKISRIFIDEKVPLHARDEWPILVDDDNKILALLGIRVSSVFSKHKRVNDHYVLVIERLHH